MKPLRIVVLVLGSIAALIGLALFAAGGILTWALATQRDSADYFTTSNQRFRTSTAAITTRDIDLGTPGPDDWWADRDLATIRVRGASASSRPIFIGVGRDADVARYLAGVPHSEITDVDYDPFEVSYRRQNAAGTATPAPPGDERFWVARSRGVATRTLTWHPRAGNWAIVVMNADGRAPVVADIDIGVKVRYLVPLAIGLGGGGFVLMLIGVVLIVLGARHGRDETDGADREEGATPVPVGAVTDGARRPEPAQLSGRLDPDLSNWQWLVKWILAIPHFIVLFFLWVAFFVLTVVAFFAILFTGRYPRALFDFNVGVLRWNWRVQYYATSVLGTDRYPPFSLAPADYPASLDIEYPDHLSRGLVLVKSWLLAIPQLVIVGAFTATGAIGRNRAYATISLLGALVLVAAFALLFTRRYPRGLFDFNMGIHRWIIRVVAYVALMTDRYPPFRLDQGPDEPAAVAPTPEPPTAPVGAVPEGGAPS